MSFLTTQTLPDPDSPLNERFPAKAIKLAIAEVKQSEEPSRGHEEHRIILGFSLHRNVMKWVDKHRNIWRTC